MYKKSIKENSKYLTPFIEGIKYYDSNDIEHAIGTMMILNDKGDVLTCKHIAKEFIINRNLQNNYKKLINNLKTNTPKKKKELEKEYNLKEDSVVLTDIKLLFNISDNNGNYTFDVILHKHLDLALIRFKNAKTKLDNYPVFSKELPQQGQSICKLGYAFPEYSLFEYSEKENNIVLKQQQIMNFPVFPLDGIVTRLIKDKQGNTTMFETSSPGLRGQSGGPVFDPDGLVYGIQSMTAHLDLNFDINQKVKRGYYDKQISYTPFINLGVAISSKEIINFLKDSQVEFQSK